MDDARESNSARGSPRRGGGRLDAGGGVINIKTRKTEKLPGIALPRSTDMCPSGNVLAIGGKSIAYVKQSRVVCVRGQ